MSARLLITPIVLCLATACDELPFASDDDRGAMSIVQLAAAGSKTCGLSRNGDVYCWGNNGGGGLGDGTTEPRLEPVRVRLPGEASSVHGAMCALVRHTMYCWGSHYFDASDTTIASTALATDHEWRTASRKGDWEMCAIDREERAWCWYDGAPRLVPGELRWKSISTGGYPVCGISTDDRGWCWGSNSGGALGNGEHPTYDSVVIYSVPQEVVGDHRWRTIEVMIGGACGLTMEGVAMCWGSGIGQWPPEPWLPRHTPFPIGLNGTRLTAGNSHVCVLSLGAVYCWGRNGSGQLGTGSFEEPLAPARVASSVEYIDVVAGPAHTCAITRAGAVECWGANGSLQLGDGTAHDRPAPVRVALE